MTDQPDGAHVRTQVTDAASVGARLDDSVARRVSSATCVRRSSEPRMAW